MELNKEGQKLSNVNNNPDRLELEAGDNIHKEVMEFEDKKEISGDLAQALECLAAMWNQYCPRPWTHCSMCAGENAEELLCGHKFMRDDETAIRIEDDDYPYVANV